MVNIVNAFCALVVSLALPFVWLTLLWVCATLCMCVRVLTKDCILGYITLYLPNVLTIVPYIVFSVILLCLARSV